MMVFRDSARPAGAAGALSPPPLPLFPPATNTLAKLIFFFQKISVIKNLFFFQKFLLKIFVSKMNNRILAHGMPKRWPSFHIK